MSYLQLALKVIERKEPEDIKPFPEEWLSRFDEGTLERLAIITVDGGLTDSEALEAIDQKPHIRLVEKKALPQEPKTIWSNPFPMGTPEARQESLRVIEEAKAATRHDQETNKRRT